MTPISGMNGLDMSPYCFEGAQLLFACSVYLFTSSPVINLV